MKDVELPDNPARKTLLLDKHADYIEAFERDKDDFVRTGENIYDCFSLIEKGIVYMCSHTLTGLLYSGVPPY